VDRAVVDVHVLELEEGRLPVAGGVRAHTAAFVPR
jgi:hypothetical protein